ncbi:cupin domain-containing protein [Gloeocapsa sp. PCC 73106]|uniref:cupin domain-containing protein n=1 Tax=Gloeocapsa sp. PCC 73106 TaxID=102232 RepID=UPI0002ACF298|nr:WxcM-like domain-containing protein [Gloeocapsa sp. PCC 73106]ELR99298.1 dTDP-4-dehydrorhamnose 3,5-epimerase-like enzyme [Gloeocapsa sp. PCC 73106]
MGLKRQISINSLESIEAGKTRFYTPQSSDQTMLVNISPGTIEDLFVHKFQTDQLLVVKGNVTLVILSNRQYEYIYLSEDYPQVVTIPPGVPHGAINLSKESCLVVNAVIRHGIASAKDYQPIKPPFPYDLNKASRKLSRNFEQIRYIMN